MPHDQDPDVVPVLPGPLILVVDDEATPRTTITRMVRGLGYHVRSCRGGREALRFLQTYPRKVRLLIVDIGMPDMDGGELVERARDLDPTLRALLVVNHSDDHTAELLPGYRDLPCLEKPVNFEALYRKVDELIGPAAWSTPNPTPQPRSMSSPRSRARRPSGHHELGRD